MNPPPAEQPGDYPPGSSIPPAAPPPPPYRGYGGGSPGQPVTWGLQMKRRNIFVVWLLLPIITVGIYAIYWYYKTNKELAEFDERKGYRPINSLLAVFPGAIIIVPTLVSVWRFGKRIQDAQISAGLPPTCDQIINFVLAILGFGALYEQFQLNKVIDQYDVPAGAQVGLVE